MILVKDSKVYDLLKFLAQILLPALGTLYFSLAGVWDLPSAQEVVSTVLAVDTFLGVLLGLSSAAYNKSDAQYDGVMQVMNTENKKTFQLQLDGDPEQLSTKDKVVFKVNEVGLTLVEALVMLLVAAVIVALLFGFR